MRLFILLVVCGAPLGVTTPFVAGCATSTIDGGIEIEDNLSGQIALDRGPTNKTSVYVTSFPPTITSVEIIENNKRSPIIAFLEDHALEIVIGTVVIGGIVYFSKDKKGGGSSGSGGSGSSPPPGGGHP